MNRTKIGIDPPVKPGDDRGERGDDMDLAELI